MTSQVGVQDDRQRFKVMAEVYDCMAPHLVPQYNWMQQEMLRLLRVQNMFGSLVDLGAGSGIFLEKALMSNPDLRGVWVDSSPGFMDVAQRRLAGVDDRMTYILSPLEEDWERRLAGPVRAVVSMSAIHHLESAEKRDLYERCHNVLTRGGWFLNCDEMSTVDRDAYLNSLHTWVEHVEGAGWRIGPEQMPQYERWKTHFARWKSRNIKHFDQPKHKGDDLHDSFLDQLTWLREIGFEGVDLFAKYHLWSMIGGRK